MGVGNTLTVPYFMIYETILLGQNCREVSVCPGKYRFTSISIGRYRSVHQQICSPVSYLFAYLAWLHQFQLTIPHLLSIKHINTMNCLFFALTLLTVSPHACFGFTAASSSKRSTTSVNFIPSPESHDHLVDSSIAAIAPKPKNTKPRLDYPLFNGPRAALAKAIIQELCKEHLGQEGEIDEDDLLDECFV